MYGWVYGNCRAASELVLAAVGGGQGQRVHSRRHVRLYVASDDGATLHCIDGDTEVRTNRPQNTPPCALGREEIA